MSSNGIIVCGNEARNFRIVISGLEVVEFVLLDIIGSLRGLFFAKR